jgi:hypothetical protein
MSKGTSDPLTWMFDYHIDWTPPVRPVDAAR